MAIRKTGLRKKGACGGTPRNDGSGAGTGNRGTKQQPSKKKK